MERAVEHDLLEVAQDRCSVDLVEKDGEREGIADSVGKLDDWIQPLAELFGSHGGVHLQGKEEILRRGHQQDEQRVDDLLWAFAP